jgi:trehalose 6-phosphate synthase/phosphatase
MVVTRLFIISNRLPVCISGDDNHPVITPSSGGLVTAMNSYLKKATHHFSEIFWAGVPECTASTWVKAMAQFTGIDYSLIPVPVYKQQYNAYYNGFSNSVLWPLFHYFPSYAEYNTEEYKHYLQVNEHFLEVLLLHLRPGDTVWIQDYHLLPLAAMLRKSMPELTIGFFLHIPFPSFELIRLLPRSWQEQLLRGMLGADLIGFHTIDYATHFLQTLQMVLGIDHDRHLIRYEQRLVKIDVFPISIDYKKFNEGFDIKKVRERRAELKEQFKGKKIIFSVDRLDYTKGVNNRLKAYEYFLQQHPEYHNKVLFIIVIVPSRDTIPKYAERKKLIDETITKINSNIGNIYWQPVMYQYDSLSFDEMLALYTTCDLALITPLRDGMNLVAKEFIASRKDKKGVLILSEMAGAARELTNALTINPNDVQEIADKIQEGLEMERDEQEVRLQTMQQRIATYDVHAWAQDFFNELQNIKTKQEEYRVSFIDSYTKKELIGAYINSGRRLLLLDYDGTLVPYAPLPEIAAPGPQLISLLQGITDEKENDVFITSGRCSQQLDGWFGHLPLTLVAEHGARFKLKEGNWENASGTHNGWIPGVQQIMNAYVRRCPNSFVEVKEFSIVWHYRNAMPVQGKLRAQELAAEIKEYIHNRHLQLLMDHKVIEVRNQEVDKLKTISKHLAKKEYDFTLAIGSDKTNEAVFRVFQSKENCYTIKVGPEASYAQYNLLTPQMVFSLLESMHYFNKNILA